MLTTNIKVLPSYQGPGANYSFRNEVEELGIFHNKKPSLPVIFKHSVSQISSWSLIRMCLLNNQDDQPLLFGRDPLI